MEETQSHRQSPTVWGSTQDLASRDINNILPHPRPPKPAQDKREGTIVTWVAGESGRMAPLEYVCPGLPRNVLPTGHPLGAASVPAASLTCLSISTPIALRNTSGRRMVSGASTLYSGSKTRDKASRGGCSRLELDGTVVQSVQWQARSPALAEDPPEVVLLHQNLSQVRRLLPLRSNHGGVHLP